MSAELRADGPDTVEITREPADPGRVRRAWVAVLLPLLMLDTFVLVVVLAIVRRGASNTPVVLWVFLGATILMVMLFVATVIPRRMQRIRAQGEGRVASWRARLPRGQWVWAVSGFGTHGVESIIVRAIGASGESDPEVSGPDAAAWCLDARTGGPVEPIARTRGREPDVSAWRFEPGPGVDAQVFLTIDHAGRGGGTGGAWSVGIEATYAGSTPSETLVVQRLTPSEARGLRPEDR